MKALTLTQPWASLVALGEKRYETRSWGTAHRGPLAIHAAKSFPRECYEDALRAPFRPVLARHFGTNPSTWPLHAHRGLVIAVCRVVEVLRIGPILPDGVTLQEAEFGDWSSGRYAWRLEDVEAIEPVAARGALGLWDWARP